MASFVLGRSPVTPPSSGRILSYRGDKEMCRTVLSSDVDARLINAFTEVPRGRELQHEGYNNACGCYCWGYRPPKVQLIGLGREYAAHKFPLCLDPCPCPVETVTETVEADCPDCPVPEPCPPGEGTPGDEKKPRDKFGVNMGLLLAALVTGGAGYYGYKKGWFKK